MAKKNILILGGTGAMGVSLVSFMEGTREYLITVTSRSFHESRDYVSYIKGNAHDKEFLESLLSKHWDVIVDFMVYGTEEFRNRVELLLSNTNQYIFISSARVYAESDKPITENTDRLLDVSTDTEYLSTDEYALTKARQEDILKQTGKKNFTIIRPSITYSNNRLQLGVLEKENWLYRALQGRKIVFSEDIADKITTMTTGYDVIKGIAAIIGEKDACGETFHITESNSYTWSEILSVYLDVIEEKTGKRPVVMMTPKSTNLKLGGGRVYQVIYCRYYNRRFDCSKIAKYVDVRNFTDAKEGLALCLKEFLDNPKFDSINWRLEAYNDKASGERACLKEIPGLKAKIRYLMWRYA